MIGLDTNVLVRYFAQDDEQQSAIANNLIDQLTSDSPGFISMVTLIELVWVMKSCYQANRDQVIIILNELIHTQELIIENMEAIFPALKLYSSRNADFADCVIESVGKVAGCSHTVTFDKAAASLTGMNLLQ